MNFYLHYYYFTGWKEVFENMGRLLTVAGFVLLGDIIDTR